MTVRAPSQFADRNADPLARALDYEIAGEMASALGRSGRKAEQALCRLKECAPGDPARPAALKQAAAAVHAYLIQRELCGMRRHDAVIREYAIPREVLVRLGAS